MWNNVERKVQLLESKLNISADNFIDEERRPTRASLIDGVANISDLSQNNEMCSAYYISHSLYVFSKS